MSPFPDKIGHAAQNYAIVGVVLLGVATVVGVVALWMYLPPTTAIIASGALVTFAGGMITQFFGILHNQQKTQEDVAAAHDIAADTNAKVDTVHILVNNQRSVLEQRINDLERALNTAGMLTPPNHPPQAPPLPPPLPPTPFNAH